MSKDKPLIERVPAGPDSTGDIFGVLDNLERQADAVLAEIGPLDDVSEFSPAYYAASIKGRARWVRALIDSGDTPGAAFATVMLLQTVEQANLKGFKPRLTGHFRGGQMGSRGDAGDLDEWQRIANEIWTANARKSKIDVARDIEKIGERRNEKWSRHTIVKHIVKPIPKVGKKVDR
jgi:hypothetical protein